MRDSGQSSVDWNDDKTVGSKLVRFQMGDRMLLEIGLKSMFIVSGKKEKLSDFFPCPKLYMRVNLKLSRLVDLV